MLVNMQRMLKIDVLHLVSMCCFRESVSTSETPGNFKCFCRGKDSSATVMLSVLAFESIFRLVNIVAFVFDPFVFNT